MLAYFIKFDIIYLDMKKPLLFTLLPLLLLSGCDSGDATPTKVPLMFGMMHGDVSDWSLIEDNRNNQEDEEWWSLSYLTEVDYATLSGKVNKKQENFVLVSKGNEGSCGCWQGFHRSVAFYAKAHHLRIYVIEVENLQKGDDHFGLKCAKGMDEIAIFQEGKLIHIHDDNEWGQNYLEFADWMNARIVCPKMFAVSEDQLDDLYLGTEPFFIYYMRGECGDCQYVERTTLRDYLFSNKKVKARSFYFDIDPWRVIVDDQGVTHDMRDKTQYDETRTWGQYVTEVYTAKKAEYGLAEEEAGYDTGMAPTFYHILPDGNGSKGDEVIDMAGVFYNDSSEEDKISKTYFTAERLEHEALSYLKESNLANKILTGLELAPGTTEAQKAYDTEKVHEAFKVYHEPILKLLLDSAIAEE